METGPQVFVYSASMPEVRTDMREGVSRAPFIRLVSIFTTFVCNGSLIYFGALAAKPRNQHRGEAAPSTPRRSRATNTAAKPREAPRSTVRAARAKGVTSPRATPGPLILHCLDIDRVSWSQIYD